MNGWSTQLLTEFLVAMGAAGNRSAALRLAVERLAESVEAEVAAVIINHRVAAQVGFPPQGLPRGLARRLVAGDDPIDVPGVGQCRAAIVRLEGDGEGWLVVARAGDQGFDAEDRTLMRGMARILVLTLRNLALFRRERAARLASQRQAADIRERQRLLEALGTVQRMIVDRAPQQGIIDRLVADMSRFVGDPIAGVRLQDTSGDLILASVVGLDDHTRAAVARTGHSISFIAMAEDRLVVIDDYASHPSAIPVLVAAGVQTAAAVPVRQDGRPIGSVVVASYTRGRRYSTREREALTAFAESASLALTDAARTSQMIHLALHDALTGLPNRTVFSDRLEQRLRSGRRRRPPCAVLFIDIDNLKRVNDTLGHRAGDEVLIEVGRRLRANAREEDTVARLSGDEFTILLDTVDDEVEALKAAKRLLTAFRQPLEVAGRVLTLTASIGVRVALAGRDKMADVLRGADLAMYEAKARRDGMPCVFWPELDTRAVRRLELESDLRAALDAGAFRVLFQPIVDLPERRVRALEALVRWDRAELGLVSPLEFIPLAEETGLIVELGAWVLEESCRTVAALERSSGVPLELSVNLSARQLVEPGLEATVGRALASGHLPPHRLTLEITESVMLTDTRMTMERLAALRRLGVKVAIDDFGTGYSSLGYLRRLPLDVVKIDRTFIEHLADDARQAALVQAIVELCHSLELETIAEGVETEDQARCLEQLGCTLGQGYHLGRPKPAAALRGMLRAQARREPAQRAVLPGPRQATGGLSGEPIAAGARRRDGDLLPFGG